MAGVIRCPAHINFERHTHLSSWRHCRSGRPDAPRMPVPLPPLLLLPLFFLQLLLFPGVPPLLPHLFLLPLTLLRPLSH